MKEPRYTTSGGNSETKRRLISKNKNGETLIGVEGKKVRNKCVRSAGKREPKEKSKRVEGSTTLQS